MRMERKTLQQQDQLEMEIVEGALDETSFQFASAEVLRCPNGCGELSYDRHDKVSEDDKKIAAVLGVLMLVAGIIIGEGWLLLGGTLAFGYFLFATGETTAYFSCINCGGGMLDSKTIISKIGNAKALAIERALRNCEAGEKMCPSCEGRMNRIPITYVMPDSGGSIGMILIQAMIPNPKEYLDLDGCSSCGLFWFDSGEMSSVSGSESMKPDS
jgi:ferredoxin